MDRFSPLTIALILLTSCSSDENTAPDNNNFLPDIGVNIPVNLNLPEYNRLKFPGGSYEFRDIGIDNNGVIVYNIDGNQFTAFDLTDPNHPIKDCSKLIVKGIEASCTCDDGNVYDILTGQRRKNPGQGFTLRPYIATKNGNSLFIRN